MKKRCLLMAVLLAAGMLAGCGKHYEEVPDTPALTPETETTAPADQIVIEPVTEETEEQVSETKAEVSLEAPGTVWFDKDTMTAHGDIGDGSETQEAEPGEEYDVMAPVYAKGTIVSVEENAVTVEKLPDGSDTAGSTPEEMVIRIDPEQSVVVDAVNGLPVDLSDMEAGEAFEAYLGPAMTMSLPPQVTAYAVIVEIPEGVKAPVYIIAEDAVMGTDNGTLLNAYGEQDYMVSEDVDVEPYLTRNIVTLDDIHEGSRCLAWVDQYDMVTKLVLFAE